jgi:hypothetical protein
MGVVFYKRVDPFFNAGGGVTITESFEYEGNWPGTLSDPNYPNTFTGFSTPSDTTPLESFELSDGWT